MAQVQHTCTNCVPIDAAVIEVYTQMKGATDSANQAATDAEHAAEHAIGKSPYIGENGDWWEWDDARGEFVDTMVQAHGSIAVDTEMSETSTNPVQNRVVTAAVNAKYTKPSSGIPASDIASGVIPDVSNFVTKSVDNLVNYYLKSETYTKSQVNDLIAAIHQFTVMVVNSLPAASADTMYRIYLVPSADPQTQNIKDEYITLYNSGVYSWEQIGSTAIDLSGYVTTQQLNTALSAYTTTANLTTLLAAKQDVISDLATIRSGATAGATAYQKPGSGIPSSDMASAVQASLGKADTAYQKPGGGIPSTDIASGVIPTVPTISTDISADANSDTKTASPKAVKTYVDGVASDINDDIDDLETAMQTIGNGAYVVAWDGDSTPVAADIPAGVSVTYGGNTYTGSLAASASTLGKIYLVFTGTSGNYDRYVTVGSSTYSWVDIGTTAIPLSGYATDEELSQLEAEVHQLAGKFYGVFADDSDLPEGDAVGYAFVGTENPYAIWNFDGEEWSDSGSVADGITGEPGVGFSSIFTPDPYDGTVIIVLSNNDTITLDLNHNHPAYYSKVAETSNPSGGFLPDVVYSLGTLTGTVTFALAAAVTGNVNHYFWMFDTGSTAPTVTWPTGITWADGSAPTVAASKHYEISVLNGIAYYSEV